MNCEKFNGLINELAIYLRYLYEIYKNIFKQNITG
jgi:hypothetical protein